MEGISMDGIHFSRFAQLVYEKIQFLTTVLKLAGEIVKT
jgi:hypothetical protein